MTAKRCVLIVILASLLLAVPLGASAAHDVQTVAIINADVEKNCLAVLARAIDALQSSCNSVGRNKACYANNQVRAEPQSGTSIKFDTVGDIEAIQSISRIITSPLNIQENMWGLSLFKLQANLPDTLPGQNITFLVFGDTSVDNITGDMKVFYFNTKLGEPSCQSAPADGIVVRSPNHEHVSFTANGVQINIASTVVLRAKPNGDMTVDMIQGSARVIANGSSKLLASGQSVVVHLGGDNGLTPQGGPGQPYWTPADPALQTILDALDKVDGLGDNQTRNFISNLKHGPAYAPVAQTQRPTVDIFQQDTAPVPVINTSNNNTNNVAPGGNSGSNVSSPAPTSVGLPPGCKVSKKGTIKCK